MRSSAVGMALCYTCISHLPRQSPLVLEGIWEEGGQLVGQGELTEDVWRTIAPLLPASGRGGQWREHRTGINGFL
jgi:hypothetical protein